MLKPISLAVFTCIAAGLATPPASAQDDDARGRRWFVDVTYKPLNHISVKDRSRPGNTRVFWYVTMKLTNKTGKSRPLDLTARALTPQVKPAPVVRPGLYPGVTEAIAKKEKTKKLENVLGVTGSLEDGESKHLVIIFPSLSNLANHVDVRVSGLTNTLYREGRTVWREETELSMKFHRIGDEFDPTRNKVEDKGKTWVTIKREKIRG